MVANIWCEHFSIKEAIVYLDAKHFYVYSEGRIVKKAVYIVLEIDMEGRRNVLGMYVGDIVLFIR